MTKILFFKEVDCMSVVEEIVELIKKSLSTNGTRCIVQVCEEP